MRMAHRDEQLRRNLQTREGWETFAQHRERVMRCLLREKGRLCVLGAGNGNDLDLRTLAKQFAEVHLVDLDADALTAGVERQSAAADNVFLHGGIDLAGVAKLTAGGTAADHIAGEQAAAWIDQVRQFPVPQLPGPFDVVASTCVLSQIIEAAAMLLSEEHPQFTDLLLALRTRHLRMLAELAPGGVGWLFSDFVSSDTAPDLPHVTEDKLRPYLQLSLAQHNFFSGLHPFVLQALFQQDEPLAAATEDVQLMPPWRWDLGPRIYAVCGLRAKFRPAP